MTNLSKKYDQMNKNLDILYSQDTSLKKQLEKDAAAFREEKFRPEPEQYTELLDTRIQIRPDFRDKLIEQLKGTFGKYYDYHRRDIAANEVDYLNVEDPDVFSHRAWELKYQRELALLEVVGMTKKQISKMLVAEGFLYLGGAFVIAVLLIVFGAKQILVNTLGTAFFFRLHLTIVPCVLMIPILVGIAYVIPKYQFEKMSRESIVERIRKE